MPTHEVITIPIPTIEEIDFSISAEDEWVMPEHFFETAQECELTRQRQTQSVWGWCVVTVSAHYKGITGFDTLGGCSYTSQSDFINNSGNWEDMKKAAYADLIQRIKELGSEKG